MSLFLQWLWPRPLILDFLIQTFIDYRNNCYLIQAVLKINASPNPSSYLAIIQQNYLLGDLFKLIE